MSSFTRKLFLLCLTLLVSHTSFSQKRFSFRKLLNRVHISAAIGYGNTQYSHQVVHKEQAAVVFREGDQFYIYTGKPGVVYLIQWFDGPYVRMKSYTDWNLPDIKKAIHKVKFKGEGSTLPISLSGHIDFWEKMRVGLGGALFINTLEHLKPEEEHESLGVYTPLQEKHYYLRPFAILGYKFIEHSTLSLLLDTHLGFDFTYASLDSRCIGISNLGVQNLGITIEGNISEYFRLFGRLSYERLASQDYLNEEQAVIVLERQSVLFQLGLSFNCPEIPRCPLPDCKVERKHKHGGEAYRGVSIFTDRDAQGRRLYNLK